MESWKESGISCEGWPKRGW